MPPTFLITIDTEADDEWHDEGDRTYANIQALPRLQDLCDRHGLKPTYLVTYDVTADDPSRETLQTLSRAGNCEVGAHLHAWSTPPHYDLMPGIFQHSPYLHEFPPDIQAAKLDSLTDALTAAFGKPRSYRGGRWSFDSLAASMLIERGYVVDTSVTPGISWRINGGYEPGSGGPDFSRETVRPYRLVLDGQELVEAPVSIAATGALRRLAHSPFDSLGALGALCRRGLHKTGLCRMVWLRPGFSSADEMHWVCDELWRQGVPLLNLMFHSSELIPRGSPRVRTQSAADEIWASLDSVFDYVTNHVGAQSVTLTSWARDWQEQHRSAAPAPATPATLREAPTHG
ncbi:MAG: hypothetical protein ABFD96_04840 [Armatimonadia bacterium]